MIPERRAAAFADGLADLWIRFINEDCWHD